MVTTNPVITPAGSAVSTGPSNVTVTPTEFARWVISDTLANAVSVNPKHYMSANEDRSMVLAAGEVLFLFSAAKVAVTETPI